MPAAHPGFPTRPVAAQAEPVRYSSAFFEYVGATAMTVTGGATGRTYRFEQPGARLAVDPADEPSLRRVPNLRVVYSP
jgi:hypothetical protein